MLGHRQKCLSSYWAKIFHPHSSRRTLWNSTSSTNEINACKVHGRKGRKAKHRISSLAPVSLHLGHPLDHCDSAKNEVNQTKKIILTSKKAKFSTKAEKKTKRNCLRLTNIGPKKTNGDKNGAKKLRLFPDSVFKNQNKSTNKVLFSDIWLEKHEQLIARR